MQTKVSIVMPVYNKIEYIDMMLESVHNQVWDNVELILVNDGATDGTRDRLSWWEPRLRARGYEVVIVDQENQGVPAAVKAGLLKITGGYVCLADCDDRLESDYVSTMAGWLDEHPEDQWAVCLYNMFLKEGGCERIITSVKAEKIPCPPMMMEKHLSGWYASEVWIYMVRSAYLRACKVTEHFITDIRSTQEPCFLYPLITGGGSIKLIEKPLYNYNYYQTRTSAHQSARYAIEFQDNYRKVVNRAIDKLDAGKHQKKKWRVMAELAHKRYLIESLKKCDDGDEYLSKLASDTAQLISTYFKPDPCITAEHIVMNDFFILYPAIADCMLGKALLRPMPSGRIIGCGALGAIGEERIPSLVGTFLEPAELWDQSALPGDELCGIPVCAPDFDTLAPEDTVLIFPINPEIAEQLHREAENRGVNDIYSDFDIRKLFPALKYPQFYNECKFVVSGGSL